jgi:hypothetical protein
MQNFGFHLLREDAGTIHASNGKDTRGGARFQAHGFLPEALISTFVIDYILLLRVDSPFKSVKWEGGAV